MNIASAELLQNSLQNLGNTFARQRQMDLERERMQKELELSKERNSTDKALREAQLQYAMNRGKSEDQRAEAADRRADAAQQTEKDRAQYEKQRLDLANQPKIQADLRTDDGQAMTFAGTPEQLDHLVAAAKQQGKTVTVENKKAFAAQFTVGGAQFSFQDQGAADKFASQMKEHGVDVYAPPQAKTPVPQMDEEKEEIDAVPDSPATPEVSHMFGANEPAKPAVKGHGKITRTRHIPAGGAPVTAEDVNSQVQGAAAPAPTPPAAPLPGNAPATIGGFPKPPFAHVQALIANPDRAGDFDQKYGPGTAAKILAAADYMKQNQPGAAQRTIPGGGGMPIMKPDGMPQTPDDQ